jgi:O-antigen/teichoic acid export membrane protein
MITKLKSYIQLIFMKKQSTITPEGRASERARRIAQTSITSIFARVVNVLSGLITVPLALPYLGIEQFGIWMALTGFVSLLSFTDLGLSIGLQSALTKCHGTNDREKPSRLIASAFLLIFLLVVILCVIAIYLIPLLDMTNIIDVSNQKNEPLLIHLTQTILIVFAFGLPAGIIQRIFVAYQEGFILNILLIIGRIIGLTSIFICIHLKLSLALMAALYMGLPLIIISFGGLYLFLSISWLRPRFFAVNINVFKEVFSVGAKALFAQLGQSIMATGPLLVLSSQFGAIAVVPYILTQRLLSVVQMIITVGLAPLWPAYGEANARGDIIWIKKTFIKSLKLSMSVALIFFVCFIFFGQTVVELWTKEQESVPTLQLLLACNVLMLIGVWNGAFSAFLNGMNRFGGQAIYGFLLPAITVYLSISLSQDIGLIFTLWFLIIFGELTRLFLMGLESYFVIRGLNLAS